MEVLTSLLPLLLIFVVFYFLMIVPQRKAAKQREAMLNALKSGDKVETVSRVIGSIVETDGDMLIVDISADSTSRKVRMNKEGIARVLTDPIVEKASK